MVGNFKKMNTAGHAEPQNGRPQQAKEVMPGAEIDLIGEKNHLC